MILTQQQQDQKPRGKAAQALVYTLVAVLVMALAAGGFSLNHWYVNRGATSNIAHIRELQSEVAELKKTASRFRDHQLVANENVTAFDAKVQAAQRRADLAHTRIQYYRDVLLIVSKTCPGRMRLPVLGGDPGQEQEIEDEN